MKQIFLLTALVALISCTQSASPTDDGAQPASPENAGAEAAVEAAGEAQAEPAQKTDEAQQAAAQKLNEKGMDFYKKKDYPQAAAEFEKAIAADPTHKFANYNLACVYALMFDECEPEGIAKTDVFAQLKKAVDADAKVKTKAPKDSDFKKFHGDVGFLAALGLLPAPGDAAGWQNVLAGKKSWNLGNCGHGVYESFCDRIRFDAGGKFVKNVLNRQCFGDPDAEECKGFNMDDPHIKQPGSYTINGAKAVLKFDGGETAELALPISEPETDPCGI